MALVIDAASGFVAMFLTSERSIFIVSTGYSNDPIMAAYKEYGFSGVVAKPYGVADFAAAVHNVLTEKET